MSYNAHPDRYWLSVMALIIAGAVFCVGGAVGALTAPDGPVTPTVPPISAGPLNVVQDVTSLTPSFPGVDQRVLVAAQLTACADLQSGLTYEVTVADIGRRFSIAGQLRYFLTTSAVDTFCFDQDNKITS